MKTPNKTLILLYIALAICGRTTTNAQSSTSTSLPIYFDIKTFETPSFTCTPIHPLKTGDNIPVTSSENQKWSIDKSPLQVGTQQVQYPTLTMLKVADGSFQGIFPVVLKAKVDVKAGEVLKVDGYDIEAKRAIKAGDSIYALLIGDAFLSIEESDGKPWLTVYKDHPKSRNPASDRAAILAAWHTVNEHVGR